VTERLWAPWRESYVTAPQQADNECIFCTKPKQERDAENLIVYRDIHSYVILNAYPYNNGHLMVVPYEHVANLDDIATEVLCEMMSVAQRAVRVLRHALKPSGFNVGINLGAAAGAGIAGHLHLHMVPRWIGDTNFMAVVADTRVLSQALASSYEILHRGFDEIS
jgi:ATP adenylyltransferase